MSSLLKNVVIIGASGNVGRLILDGFDGKSQFNVTVLTRSSSNATFPSSVTVRKTDYSDDDLVAAFKGQDAVISVLGMEGLSLQKKFVDASLKAGVQRFLPSEFSFNSLSPAVQELLPPVVDQKLDVLNYLEEKAPQGSRLTWTALYIALLFDWSLQNGFLEYNLSTKTATIWDSGDTTFTLANVDQMQHAIIAVLERPGKTANKHLYVASVETSQNAILAALEKATKAKWTVTHTTTEKEVGAGREALASGDFGGAMKLVRGTSFANIPDLRANYARDGVLANDLLGLSMEPVEATVERVLQASK